MAFGSAGKKGITSSTPIKFKPFKTDLGEIDSICRATGKSRPEVVRELVSEHLKARRLKQVGKDTVRDDVVAMQKRAMAEMLLPLEKEISTLKTTTESLQLRVIDEFDHAERKMSFLVLCIRFIVFEVIIARIHLKDYVHTVYKMFVESIGKSAKDVETNYQRRLESYREEAASILDNLSEESAGDLHALADRKNAFSESAPTAEAQT